MLPTQIEPHKELPEALEINGNMPLNISIMMMMWQIRTGHMHLIFMMIGNLKALIMTL